MIKHVVFDWNGTLVADTKLVWRADNHVIKSYGGKKVPFNQYGRHSFKSAFDYYASYGADKNKMKVREVGRIQNSFYEERSEKLRTRKGARFFLEWLKENKIKSIIVSNHTRKGIHKQLGRLGLTDYFSHVFAHNEECGFVKSKSKFSKLNHYFKKINLNPQNSLILGDAGEELSAGRRLGMVSVAMLGGVHSASILKKEKPNFLINNLNECVEIIKKVNKNSV